ncbi:hypothetical protein FSP39_008713 [Pinctada imbricata]|uniref:ADP-ribosylation factor-like protein 6 n=1 Tax=Pinctada imbricata TaxID=66713 RepID=A0AA88YB71_PINIB|nr:hypothetical protein FSP39_008713 [Pinctada imbricata]
MGCTSSVSRKDSCASFKIILVGADNAGKTTILYRLAIDELVSTTPTMGFNVETFVYRGVTITVWDMGGLPSIQKHWKDYYMDCQGIFFVVDSAARDKLQEADDVLNKILNEKTLLGIPMVVIANKNDISDSMSEKDIMDYFGLEEIRDRLCTIQSASSITGEGLNNALDNLIRFRKHIDRTIV